MIVESERGSLWRRWDLHVHTPDTILNNQFTSWDEYLDAIEAHGESVSVIGVTDYLSINGYQKLCGYRDAGRTPGISLIIPNIEFRISPHTRHAKGINLHLLVSPHPPNHCERIDEALSRLTIEIKGERIPCNRSGFVRLGYLNKPECGSEENAIQEGINQYKVDFGVFRDWYRRESWIKAHSLIAVASASTDGTSGLQQDSGYTAVRREIEAFADIIFSGNPKDRDFWLGIGPLAPQSVKDTYRGLKPCVHGSDAHSIKKMFLPDADRFCWIKVDPTFEGLRQIVYEPEERVHIGSYAPTRYNKDAVVDRIVIRGADSWLKTSQILFNPGLVAIIGAKGSGKTALADLVATAAGASVDPEGSFITRAGEYLRGIGIELHWANGRKSNEQLPCTDNIGENGAKYLSQKFVDRLCGSEDLGQALLEEIETVIFDHLDEEKTMSASSFRELRELKTAALRERRSDIRGEISSLNTEISQIDKEESLVPEKRRKGAKLEKQLDALRKQYPEIKDKETKQVVSDLENAQTRQKQITEKVSDLRISRQRLYDMRSKIEQFERRQKFFWEEVRSELASLGMEKEQTDSLKPVMPADVYMFIDNFDKKLDKEVNALLGLSKSDKDDDTTLAYWKRQMKNLEEVLKLDESKRKQLCSLRLQYQRIDRSKTKLENEIAKYESESVARRKRAVAQRFTVYLEYFDILDREVTLLKELYQPLAQNLKDAAEHERRLEFSIRTKIDLTSWANRGEELIDQRKVGPFRTRNSIANEASGLLSSAWIAHDLSAIKKGITHMIKKFGSAKQVQAQLRSEYDLVDVADWLFSVDHIGLEYNLKYDGAELTKLSPGMKGIVLLILYLAIDSNDQRPLIVDQPDENLDNESIYNILRPYFRQARSRRQIILITHNPNLVVNTDADQVIVANAFHRQEGLPFIRYRAGGLEAIGQDRETKLNMKQTVCQLLEGGKEAFEMRERKYTEWNEQLGGKDIRPT
ncbi:MAG: AAA family ATPase [Planctomycetes bacterium]|nr:AAA family ATPase [Planctomycetota bacterium]